MIIVNDHIADTNPNQVIAVTYKGIEIGDIQSRFLSHTNRIKLPDTNTNRAIFQNANEEESLTSIPYEILNFKFVEGVEVFTGKGFLKAFNDGFELEAYSNVIDFFDRIRDKLVSDLRYLSNTPWTAVGVQALADNDSGVLAPVINWGRFSGFNMNYPYILPSYSYADIVKNIITSNGYTYEGDIFTDEIFEALIIPYSKDELIYSQVFSDERSFQATGENQGLDDSAQTVQIEFPNVTQGALAWFDNDEWTIPDFSSTGTIGKVRLTASALITVDGISSPTITDLVTVRLKKNSGILLDESVVMPDTIAEQFEFNFDGVFDWADEDVFYMEIESTGGPNIDIDNVSLVGVVSREPQVGLFFHDYLLPEVSQESIMKDFLVRFGLLVKLEENNLIFKKLQDIISNRENALDISDSLTGEKKGIGFLYSNYAQNNYFKYDDLTENGLGQGNLEYQNLNAKLDNDYFVSIFGNSETLQQNALSVFSTIPVYDADSTNIYEFANPPGLRLLMIRQNDIGVDGGITYNTNVNDYKIGYFVDSNQPFDCGFQYFIDNYYGGLKNAFERPRAVSKIFKFNVAKFVQLDPFRLVWDGEGYYIITNISNYIAGKVCQVDMFKI